MGGHSVNIWVFSQDELVATIICLLKFLVFVIGKGDKNTRSWSFGFACFTNFSSALHVNVGEVLFFTKNWQVREDINGRNVCCDDYNTTINS